MSEQVRGGWHEVTLFLGPCSSKTAADIGLAIGALAAKVAGHPIYVDELKVVPVERVPHHPDWSLGHDQ